MKYKGVLFLLLISIQLVGQYLPEELLRYEKFHGDRSSLNFKKQEKIDRSFNVEGDLIKEVYWKWNLWKKELLINKEVNNTYENGKLTQKEIAKYIQEELTTKIFIEYKYDEDCLVSSESIEYFYGELHRLQKSQYVNCKREIILFYIRSGNTWILSGKTEFSNGNLVIGSYYFELEMEVWQPKFGQFEEWNSQGNLLREEIIDHWDNKTTNILYEYSSDNKVIKKESYEGTVEDIFVRQISETHYTYDQRGRIITEERFIPIFESEELKLMAYSNYEYELNEEGLVIEERIRKGARIGAFGIGWGPIEAYTFYNKYYCNGQLQQKLTSKTDIEFEIVENFYPRNVTPCPNNGERSTPIVVFPNPANNLLFIQNSFLQFYDCQLSIHDAHGKIVHRQIIYTEIGEYTLDVSTFTPGLYYIELSSQQHVSQSKFVKI